MFDDPRDHRTFGHHNPRHLQATKWDEHPSACLADGDIRGTLEAAERIALALRDLSRCAGERDRRSYALSPFPTVGDGQERMTGIERPKSIVVKRAEISL